VGLQDDLDVVWVGLPPADAAGDFGAGDVVEVVAEGVRVAVEV